MILVNIFDLLSLALKLTKSFNREFLWFLVIFDLLWLALKLAEVFNSKLLWFFVYIFDLLSLALKLSQVGNFGTMWIFLEHFHPSISLVSILHIDPFLKGPGGKPQNANPSDERTDK